MAGRVRVRSRVLIRTAAVVVVVDEFRIRFRVGFSVGFRVGFGEDARSGGGSAGNPLLAGSGSASVHGGFAI